MLRFFRRFRKRPDGRRSAQDYLLSTPGLISVIAIGAYIALQIIDWQRGPEELGAVGEGENGNSAIESGAVLQDSKTPNVQSTPNLPKEGGFAYTPRTGYFMTEYRRLRDLSFMNRVPLPIGEPPTSFHWSYADLAEALYYFKEYEHYDAESYPSENHVQTDDFLRAVLLEQLQVAVGQKLRSAQTPQNRAVEVTATAGFEAELMASLDNFSGASVTMIALRDWLRKLEFTEIENSFVAATEGHALALVDGIDRLSEMQNRPYGSAVIQSPVKDNFLADVFRISSANSLENYLVSQRQRISYLVYEYASIPIKFLMQANDELEFQSAEQTKIATKWRETLVQVENYQRDDGSSHLQILEETFRDAIGVSKADCAFEPKRFPNGHVDVFARAHKDLIARIEAYCGLASPQ